MRIHESIPPAELFLNRELGQLAFNRRVLAQAADETTPLLERLRFLCIVSSNLDEFFEIRVAGLHAEIEAGTSAQGPDQTPVRVVYREVARAAHALVDEQYRLFNDAIAPALARKGIRFLQPDDLDPAQAAWIAEYFQSSVMPVLTPIGLDPSHPFPRVLNKSLHFAVLLEGDDAYGRDAGTAIVQAPRALPRVLRLPPEVAGAEYDFVTLSSMMRARVGDLFPGMTVRGCHQFRLTRNSDLFVDEEEVEDLRAALSGELPNRGFGDEVRLEISVRCPPALAEFLMTRFGLEPDDVYRVDGPVNLVRLMEVIDEVHRADLKFPPFTPGVPPRFMRAADPFEALRAGDLLLHHPYQSFDRVIAFLREAARDPRVVAIKQTVYRTGANSEIMETLIEAARSGKEVTVVLELLARFDEEANINWAQRLEQVGAHVVYGVVGTKTHAKMLLVVRREEANGVSTLRRYVHLSTGNYHARTARLYTDLALFTCDEAISADVNDMFMQLTGLGRASTLRRLWQAPFTLHEHVLTAIRQETAHAREGRAAAIIARMNALLEPEVINALYEASQAGVRIDLIVRGVCALKPGMPGVSDNIRVRSIIGRFLEHTRAFYFFNDGAEDVYLSSADWMGRNFFGRVEVCFPVRDARLKQRVIDEALRACLDDPHAWIMDAGGGYSRAPAAAGPGSQQQLLSRLAAS
jgi:polyphosphate kinase